MDLTEIKDKIEKNGDPVLYDTDFCKKYQFDHGSCDNCRSKPGCIKIFKIALMRHELADRIESVINE